MSARQKSVSSFVLDVAKDPIKHAKLALDFVNGKARGFMVTYLSKALGWASGKVAAALGRSIPQAEEAAAYSACLWATGEADLSQFPALVKFMEAAMKVLKIATVCVQIVTTFFAEMAQKGSWANAVAKAVGMGGAAAGSITLSTSLAAGIVVAKLFDMFVNSCFGNFSIAPSMRLPMSVSLVASLDSSMSAVMSSSLLPD